MPGRRAPCTLDQQETVWSTGLFLQGRLEVTRHVAAQGALRYDRFRFRVADRFLSDGSDDSGGRTMTAVSPSLGLVVDAGRGFELFGSVSSVVRDAHDDASWPTGPMAPAASIRI